FAVVGRLGTALLIGSALFLVLGFANLAKMQYMHAAVQPLDVLYLAEFMPQFVATFGTAGAGALLTAAALVVFAIFATWRRKRLPISAGHRAIVGILGLAVLTTASFSQTNAPLRRA